MGPAGSGRKDCLNHRLRKGYSPKGGDQIFSGPTKDQLRINDNYSPGGIGETEGGRRSKHAHPTFNQAHPALFFFLRNLPWVHSCQLQGPVIIHSFNKHRVSGRD